MGHGHSHSDSAEPERPRKQGQVPAKPSEPLSLPIANRRARALAATPDAASAPLQAVQTGQPVLPINNRKTRAVRLAAEEDESPAGLAAGGATCKAGAPAPCFQGLACGGPHVTSPVSVVSSVPTRKSQVHFATSPASVVEITPYSWVSSESASPAKLGDVLSPVSPAPCVQANPAVYHQVVRSAPGYPLPVQASWPVSQPQLPLAQPVAQPAVQPARLQRVIYAAPQPASNYAPMPAASVQSA
mmetsp:Transcript_53964/g.96623  ORF Transcript_53964/g.96623 Transcript_53964/m.96623 type:complete len:244 (-) Transcript_53964:41-772(-)